MDIDNIYNVHARGRQAFLQILFCCHLVTVLSLTLVSCQSDWRDGIASQWSTDPVAFTGSVVSSQKATRADGSIVNLNVTALPATSVKSYQVGLFGAYTGQYKWASLVAKAEAQTLTEAEGETYSANLIYNLPADINADGTLTYSPLRFWPNNKIATGDDVGKYEYCTFWAYYPYNPTDTPGDYGIGISTADVGKGKGMGRIHFTMHTDAADQTDFMVSEPAIDCNRDKYPLISDGTANGFTPKPVPLRFHHALAQVRIYTIINGTDKIVYAVDNAADDKILRATAEDVSNNRQVVDAWGNSHVVTLGEAIPDDTDWLTNEQKTYKTVRWARTGTPDITGRNPAELSYSLEFNNIKTEATFFPVYSGGTATIGHEEADKLSSVTVNNYSINPDWFLVHGSGEVNAGERYKLNDTYMYGDENYAPGNILLMVPQMLNDQNVPHIVLTVKGQATQGSTTKEWTARTTINLLKMDIKWESGFIYCYAILDELQPGDDKVRGPESITVVFDTTQRTDQW